MAWLRILLLGWLLVASTVNAREKTIYVDLLGTDANEGYSKAEAVQTLQRAMSQAESMADDITSIKIEIAAGTYKAQRFSAQGNERIPITITAAAGAKVIFDGAGEGGTWMTLRQRRGELSGIKVSELEVTNYETAIDMRGDREHLEHQVGGMEIRHNRFRNIGNIARSGAQPSTAAIRLVNSRHNVIVRNVFSGIRNTRSCGLLHAIYVAHHSSENLIENNYFSDSCGDPIRFRDESNQNVVRLNTFKDAWYKSPVSDWFCDGGTRNDCTKKTPECPSVDNVLEANKVISEKTEKPELFIPWGEPPAACKTGQRILLK